jgi:hypothetical protein
LGDKFSLFFDLKNVISTPTKDFCEKDGPHSPDFYTIKVIRFLQQVPAGSHKIKGILNSSTFVSGL